MKIFSLLIILFTGFKLFAVQEPYSILLEQISIPGAPKIHSFAFADYNGKWLFVGGRVNGMHGFDAVSSFPKQYSNTNIFVVNPSTAQTFSRSIFSNLDFQTADPLRSTNMQYYFDGNKLFITGGFGYDSTSNGLITFPSITVIDVPQIIQAITEGTTIAPFVRQINDERMRVSGGEMTKLGDYFYLVGGHNFTGTYVTSGNNQIYSNQIKKFKINDNGSEVSISEYTSFTDTVEFHRRDMNLVPAVKPDGIGMYAILYGGVFKTTADLPYQNPVYIDNSGINVDYGFEQKMSQYSCSFLTAFNASDGSMHTTFFGGTSLYYYNETLHQQIRDSLVPFINDITTLTKRQDGSSDEIISSTVMPALIGTNAKFILNNSIPHYANGVIKLDDISGKTFAGYIFGGIKAFLPNNTPSYPSEFILKVYINPNNTGVSTVNNQIPDKCRLYQNFPNPFNPSTKIRFEIPQRQYVRIAVYNSMGKEEEVIISGYLNSGVYETDFSAGTEFSSGVYYCRLQADNFSESKKMLLLK